MEVDSVPQQTPEKSVPIDRADLVVGILAALDQDAVAAVCEALRTLPGSLRIVAVSRDDSQLTPAVDSGTPENGPWLRMIPWRKLGPEISGTSVPGISAAYQSIFAFSEKLEARACFIFTSKLETEMPKWVCQFTQPLLETDCDLVAPCYARQKLEGLLNSSIVRPLTRSLYGRRIQNPMGPDLGVSRRLFQRILRTNRNSGLDHPLASLASVALCNGLQVCEVHIGARDYAPTDWTNIGSLLAEVLGPIFAGMEKNAACWQKIRESIPVPVFGEASPASQHAGTVDVSRLVNSFQLGTQDLQEIWGLVLPPTTLFDLRKLSRLAAEQFHMSNELWVRMVYDFALAHRLRTISRDHLLRSMAPLYLGWVASHAREVESADAAAVEEKLERLSIAYEVGKSYLVSRWRWPDRFNP